MCKLKEIIIHGNILRFILKVENLKVAPDQVQFSGIYYSMKSKLTQLIFYATICTN